MASWLSSGFQASPDSGWKYSSGGPSPATLTCSRSRPSQTSTASSRTAAGPVVIVPPPPSGPAPAPASRRPAAPGHQWCCQPSSSQIGRSRGSTSAVNSEMFFSVSARGIEPFCSITSRLPIRNSRTNASSWSATVAGLPTIATWLSTMSLKVAVRIRASIPSGPPARSMASMAAGSA